MARIEPLGPWIVRFRLHVNWKYYLPGFSSIETWDELTFQMYYVGEKTIGFRNRWWSLEGRGHPSGFVQAKHVGGLFMRLLYLFQSREKVSYQSCIFTFLASFLNVTILKCT